MKFSVEWEGQLGKRVETIFKSTESAANTYAATNMDKYSSEIGELVTLSVTKIPDEEGKKAD